MSDNRPKPSDWINRVWTEFRAGNLTRAYRDVLLTLHSYRGHGGLICPAHATLAERAKCSVRTVQRALSMASRLGLVTWSERRVRNGWRWLRTSNRYVLLTPTTPVQPGLRPAWPRKSTTGQIDGGEERLSKKRAWEEMKREAAAMPDLLAARRKAMEARSIEQMIPAALKIDRFCPGPSGD